jgi:hypothetical protein
MGLKLTKKRTTKSSSQPKLTNFFWKKKDKSGVEETNSSHIQNKSHQGETKKILLSSIFTPNTGGRAQISIATSSRSKSLKKLIYLPSIFI